MMLSIFQSISIPSTWLRWVKWRGWWQTKSKLRGRLMTRTRQTARLVGTLIVSVLVYSFIYQMIGPWDLVSSSGCCFVCVFQYPTELARHSVCDSLNDFITSSRIHLSIYVRTRLIFIHSGWLIMGKVISEHRCSVLSVTDKYVSGWQQ